VSAGGNICLMDPTPKPTEVLGEIQGNPGTVAPINTETSGHIPRKDIWEQVWSWVVVGAVVLFVLAGGIAFMTSAHPWVADGFFLVGTLLFLAKFWTWEDAKEQPPRKKWPLLGLVTLGSLAILLTACLWNHKINTALSTAESSITQAPEDTKKSSAAILGPADAPGTQRRPPETKPVVIAPDLIADFVEPDDIALIISNPSPVTAHQPSFGTLLVNLAAPTVSILPIGRQTGDFLISHASIFRIPILHYGNNLALEGLKPADRIFGWIALTCSDCKRVRYYYVYYEYMSGGRYSESPTEPSFKNLVLNFASLSKSSMSLDEFVKPNKRVPIRDLHGPIRFPEQGTLR
jgi:hypothetical protein